MKSLLLVIGACCFAFVGQIRSIDGRYKVQYDSEFKVYSTSLDEIFIKKNLFFGYNKKMYVYKGNVSKLSENEYALFNTDTIGKSAIDSNIVSQMLKKSMDEPYIRIYKVKRDTLFFQTGFERNLHVIANTGILVRKK